MPAARRPHRPGGERLSYVVVQALEDLDAVVAEVQLPQVDQALQPLDLGQPVALQGEEPTAIRTAWRAQNRAAFRKRGFPES